MTIREIHLPNGNVEYRNEFGELHNPEGPARKDIEGNDEYRVKGQLHSIGDKPARIDKLGSHWYNGGLLHREDDKPARVFTKTGAKSWYKEGKYHREGDKPSIITKTDQSYYTHGKMHREGDKPAYTNIYGYKAWYKNDEPHRDGNKPAVIDPSAEEESNIEQFYHHGKRFYPPKHEQENGPHDYD